MKRAVAVGILVVIAGVWFEPRLVQAYQISRAESRWREWSFTVKSFIPTISS